MRTKGPKCKCGCGDFTTVGKRFINYHHLEVLNRRPFSKEHRLKISKTLRITHGKEFRRTRGPKCRCGCGLHVKLGCHFVTGHHMHLDKYRNMVSKVHKGKIISEKQKQWLRESTYRQTKEYREKQRLAQLGRKHSEETKRKISKAIKGKPFSVKHKRSLSISAKLRDPKTRLSSLEAAWKSTRGVPLSIETRRKMSQSAQGKYVKDKNPRWRGGISFEPYDPTFDPKLKRKIRKRDNHKCRCCGLLQKDHGMSLHIHHIDYNKKNSQRNNLISLCISCHAKTTAGNRLYWGRKLRRIIDAQNQN